MNINNRFKGRKKLVYVATVAAFFGHAHAQLEISKHTINNGGGFMTSEGYELNVSIGQVDAQASTGGNLTLNGGFWHENTDLIFKNKFQ